MFRKVNDGVMWFKLRFDTFDEDETRTTGTSWGFICVWVAFTVKQQTFDLITS